MNISVEQLAFAIENAIFRNHITRGQKYFTPAMFVDPQIESTHEKVMSIMSAMCASGILKCHVGLRRPGTTDLIFQGDGQKYDEFLKENPDMVQNEAVCAFEVLNDYVSKRLSLEKTEAEATADERTSKR